MGLGWSAKECWIRDDLSVEGVEGKGGDTGLVLMGLSGGWYPGYPGMLFQNKRSGRWGEHIWNL